MAAFSLLISLAIIAFVILAVGGFTAFVLLTRDGWKTAPNVSGYRIMTGEYKDRGIRFWVEKNYRIGGWRAIRGCDWTGQDAGYLTFPTQAAAEDAIRKWEAETVNPQAGARIAKVLG